MKCIACYQEAYQYIIINNRKIPVCIDHFSKRASFKTPKYSNIADFRKKDYKRSIIPSYVTEIIIMKKYDPESIFTDMNFVNNLFTLNKMEIENDS